MSEIFAIPLISKNGVRGKVLTTSRLLDESAEKSVIFETGREVSVPSSTLHLRNDGTYFLSLNVDPRPAEATEIAAIRPAAILTNTIPVQEERDEITADTSEQVTIPRIEEQVVISRRTVETARVRIRKSISEHPYIVDEPTIREECSVERVPVNRVVTETEGPRIENDVTIIPVYEQETITTTRLVLREEIHVRKVRREEQHPQTILLRKENIEIERIPTAPATGD